MTLKVMQFNHKQQRQLHKQTTDIFYYEYTSPLFFM